MFRSIVVALNDKEIFAQALIFLVAGYETTSALMSFFFYAMATEPDIQEKVYEEIRQELSDVNNIDRLTNSHQIFFFRVKLLLKISIN